MLEPSILTESEAIVGYVDQQLAGIRNAAYGLTDAQARLTPCASALSVGGIIKHATYVMGGYERRAAGQRFDQAAIAGFLGSFALTDDESLESALADFDAARERFLDTLRSFDPAAEMVEPPAPWDGRDEPVTASQRFGLMHNLEEFARHAGHADIIREQIDGADAASLLLAAEGRPGNAFVQPWKSSAPA